MYLLLQTIDLSLLKTTLTNSKNTLRYFVLDTHNMDQKITPMICSLCCFFAMDYLKLWYDAVI
jgi:hypothetical protein